MEAENKRDFSYPRYMNAPCAACGKTLIEYCGSTGVYCYNTHIKDKKYHFKHLRNQDGFPIYKCNNCTTEKRRVNIKRFLKICTKGYHAEPNCENVDECKNWGHYTIRD